MKKRNCLALLLAGVLLLSGCSKPSDNPRPPVDEEKFKAIGNIILEQLNQKDYAGIIEGMSESTKKQVNEDTLKLVWDQIEGTLGDFVQVKDVQVKSDATKVEVYVIAEYKFQGLLLSLGFDSQDKLQGFYLSYAPIDAPLIDNEIYSENKVAIGDEQFPLNGILTVPKNVDKPAVVILVQGSGSTDKDETNGKGGLKPFKDLATELAGKGIATLRYDKRFYTYPHLAVDLQSTVTIQDEVLNDVNSAIELMKHNTLVNSEKIYVLGHSLGGMLAPKIAQDNSGLAGIIMMAGSLRGLNEIIADQARAEIIKTTTMSVEEKETAIKSYEDQSAGVNKLKEGDKNMNYFGLPNTYWLSLNQALGRDIAPSLQLKMLVLQGKEDFQVYADIDYVQFQELLKGKTNVEFHLYEGLNHMFMPSTTQDLNDYDTPKHMDAKVIEDIAAFIGK